MPIEFKCICGSEYRLDDSRAGEEFACKICGKVAKLSVGSPRAIPADGEAQPVVQAVTGGLASGAGSAHALEVPKPTRSSSERLGSPVDKSPPPPPTSGPTPINHAPPGAGIDRRPDDLMGYEDLRRNGGNACTPPADWWILRSVMWALCIGVLFLPWFRVSGEVPQMGEKVSESASGFVMVKGITQGFLSAKQEAEAAGMGDMPLPKLSDLTEMPKGAGKMLAGVIFLGLGPFVYVLGLLGALVVAILAYKYDGRGAMWPFAANFVGLLLFILGWHMLAGNEQLREVLAMAREAGFHIGPSPWAYLALILLVPIALIARARPDRALAELSSWEG